MVCDLTIVFAFQILFGYVYQQVALIVGVFMAGLALGGWMATRREMNGLVAWRALVGAEIANIAFWLTLPSWLRAHGSGTPITSVTPILLAMNALGGSLVGLQFPLCCQLYLSRHGEASRSAGVLYAADLVGACMGAVAVGITLLPALGTTGTCVFVATLKTCSLLLLLVTSRIHAPQMPGIALPQNPHLPPTTS